MKSIAPYRHPRARGPNRLPSSRRLPTAVVSSTALIASAALTTGCGSSSSTAPNGSGPVVDASSLAFVPADAADNPSPFATDLAPDAGGPLQARIQVNGANTVCGTCAVILAQAQGGAPPYAYAWSDPTLQGPGPFQVCPSAPTAYSVQVTDQSGTTSGELTHANATVNAAASVDCVAPTADAAGAPNAYQGCTLFGGASGDGGTDGGDGGSTTECPMEEVEAGTAWADGGAVYAAASLLPATLLAGQAYELSYDRILPINLGQPVTLEFYGSTEPDICQADQKLFTLNLDGSIFSWHQGYCFTPDRDYHYVLYRVYIQGVYVYWNPVAASTLCVGCAGM